MNGWPIAAGTLAALLFGADASAASYRCPKPDGSLWPGWHAKCPEPAIDPNTWTPPTQEAPRCDFAGTSVLAEARCASAVEKLARFDFRWTDGLLESKFPRATCLAPGRPEIIMAGDAIQLQNAFSAWHRHGYRCVWNPQTQQVVSAEALPR